MIRRTQFLVHEGHAELAARMYARALADMPTRPLYVTIEVEPQYDKLRSKLAKRGAKRRLANTRRPDPR